MSFFFVLPFQIFGSDHNMMTSTFYALFADVALEDAAPPPNSNVEVYSRRIGAHVGTTNSDFAKLALTSEPRCPKSHKAIQGGDEVSHFETLRGPIIFTTHGNIVTGN